MGGLAQVMHRLRIPGNGLPDLKQELFFMKFICTAILGFTLTSISIHSGSSINGLLENLITGVVMKTTRISIQTAVGMTSINQIHQ
jgi:hypothetical protein